MTDKSSTSNNLNIEQFICFELETELYGIGVKKTESIERMSQITRVPDSSVHILGIINLRGDILPVLSLRQMMGIKPKSYDSDTRIIVIDAGNYRVGIVVDRVIEILSISGIEIQSAKEILTDRESHMFEGVYRAIDNIVMLLNMDWILDTGDSYFDKGKKYVADI